MAKKKTIIIAIFIREKSALTEFFMKLSEELIQLNYQVILLTNEERNDLVDTTSNPIILTWPSYYPTKIKDFLFMRKLIKSYKPIMVISNFSSTNFALIAARLYGVPHRIPWIHTISTAMTEVSPWKFWRKRYLYKFATYFIANSNATKEDSIDTYNIKPEKITTVPNLIHSNDEFISSDEDEFIVFVGRFYETKGIDVLIKAMKIVVQTLPQLKLKVIAGGNGKKYEKMVQDYNLEKNITFMGRLPREEVFKYLDKAKCSIVPSQAEAFGYVVIEAFSVKTPVIGTDTGGISEIIDDNVNGMLFPVSDEKILADKIILMMKNEELREKCAHNAYITFKKKYELDNNIQKVTGVLQKLLSQPPTS